MRITSKTPAIALKFEQFRQKYPYNKDPTWFLKKTTEDLFVFTDPVSNLSKADRRIISVDFELLAQPTSVGPFVGFTDPSKIVRDRIS